MPKTQGLTLTCIQTFAIVDVIRAQLSRNETVWLLSSGTDANELEGNASKASVCSGGRLSQPFSRHCVPAGEYACCGYLLRIPSHGGHWIAVLPGSALQSDPMLASVHEPFLPEALLCDSLYNCPFVLTRDDVEHLLTTCALDCAVLNPRLFQGEWGCFFVGYHL